MDLANSTKSQLEMSRTVHDMSSTDLLRQAAQKGDKAALKEAAQQFEAIFVQMLLKSMRKAQEALADDDSPFNSEQVKFYRDMHDQQLATDLSSKGSLGLAELIVQQMSVNEEGFMPASAIRNDANLSPMNRFQVQMRQRAESIMENASAASKQAMFSSPEDFVQSLYPQAQAAAQSLGIDPKALLAQAAVETGWGKFIMHQPNGESANNLFGIKADSRWSGNKVVVDTIEFKDALPQKQQAAFRSYEDFSASLNDYVSFVKNNPRYQDAVNQTHDPKAYFEALQKAGYATDPEYANKVMSVYEGDLMNGLLP
ncbi:flagellar assembly peptidoglycan hydrolase FlgJ [Glaciecola sp. 1036]|uniref:flagellar assembly peptidoglycan hydrolase FlgJ n=1 Tax=Alteromonadaceae TaxID=72275 RepID=UPI003D00B7FD